MRRLLMSTLLSAMFAGVAIAQEHPAPYAGLETRAIKALSPEQIEDYLNGEGMGFALAAELNHYPGPRHVLELADELSLTDDQRETAGRVFEQMKALAVTLGKEIVAKEGRLDTLFAKAQLDDETLSQVLTEIASLNGRLRYAHLRAHLAMKQVLTKHQIMLYDQLRGYGGDHDPRHHGSDSRSGGDAVRRVP